VLKAINQTNFPVAMSIIDLLLANSNVNAAPDVYSAIAALKTIVSETWEVIDEAAG